MLIWHQKHEKARLTRICIFRLKVRAFGLNQCFWGIKSPAAFKHGKLGYSISKLYAEKGQALL